MIWYQIQSDVNTLDTCFSICELHLCYLFDLMNRPACVRVEQLQTGWGKACVNPADYQSCSPHPSPWQCHTCIHTVHTQYIHTNTHSHKCFSAFETSFILVINNKDKYSFELSLYPQMSCSVLIRLSSVSCSSAPVLVFLFLCPVFWFVDSLFPVSLIPVFGSAWYLWKTFV